MFSEAAEEEMRAEIGHDAALHEELYGPPSPSHWEWFEAARRRFTHIFGDVPGHSYGEAAQVQAVPGIQDDHEVDAEYGEQDLGAHGEAPEPQELFLKGNEATVGLASATPVRSRERM